ncbi:MAG: ABC transporter permease [Magnetospirillum sp.]|nr:ABC transporter permease [Magnetospirillum sp.]
MSVVASPPPDEIAPAAAERRARAARYARARADLAEGLRAAWLWQALAAQDVRLRYRRSMLGPLWLTLSTAVMVAAMGFLYARLFGMDAHAYIPFLSTGLIVWQFISGIVAEGCQTFLDVQSIIQQTKIPYSAHAYRSVYRNILVLAHNMIIVPAVFGILGQPVGWRVLAMLPGVAVLCVNGVWMSLLVGMASARFRDIPPIVANVLQLLFFVTPVFWKPESLGRWRTVAEYNPLFAAIDVVRAPLLDQTPAPHSWPILAGLTVGGGAVAFVLFARFRSRIAYWV